MESLFVKNIKKDDRSVSKILLCIYVDECLAACGDEAMYKGFISTMSEDFDLRHSGELKWFLGTRIEQDHEKGVQLSQEQSFNGMLKRLQMSDYTPVDTPCEVNLHLGASDNLPLDEKEHIELPAKLLNYFLWSNKSNINQCGNGSQLSAAYWGVHVSDLLCSWGM